MPGAEQERGTTRILLGRGLRVGFFSMPFALLRVRADMLELFSLLCICRFSPDKVVAFEPAVSLGVRIHHRRADAPEALVFLSLLPASRVIAAIEEVGFVPTGEPATAAEAAQRDEPVVSGRFLGTAVLLIGLVALLDWLVLPDITPRQPDYAITATCMLAFVSSLLVRRRGAFRRFAMSSPDAPPRWRWLLNFITLLSGLMLFGALADTFNW